jgi:hypothetical protein
MKHRSFWSSLLLAFAVLLLSFGARSSPPASVPPPAPAAASEPASLNCTVRSVDLKTKSIDVITGVGYALRQYRMRLAPTCEIRAVGRVAIARSGSVAVGTVADLSALRPGAIVRVTYQAVPAAPKVPAHLMAVAIEVERPEETGGSR